MPRTETRFSYSLTGPKITRADPEVLMPIAERLRGIVDSLRVRGVGAPIERLLKDDDQDVRATAAIAFAASMNGTISV